MSDEKTYTLPTGETVYLRSQKQCHISKKVKDRYHDHLELALERVHSNALPEPNIDGYYIVKVDFGKRIGKSNCVFMERGDEFWKFRRKGRDPRCKFPFIKGATYRKVSTMVIALKPLISEEGAFEVRSAHWGEVVPENDRDAFWNQNAFMWGTEETVGDPEGPYTAL